MSFFDSYKDVWHTNRIEKALNLDQRESLLELEGTVSLSSVQLSLARQLPHA